MRGFLHVHVDASFLFELFWLFNNLTTKMPRCCGACVWNIWIDVKPLPGDSVRLAKKKEPSWRTWMLLHSWWSHHLVILSVSPRNRNRSDAFRAGGTAPLVLAVPTKLWTIGGWDTGRSILYLHVVILPVSPRNGTVVMHLDAVAKLVVTSFGDSVRLAMNWNRSDAPGCCCIAGGHIIWWFCPSRQEKGTVLTHLDAVA